MTDVAPGVAGPYRRLLAEPVLRGLALADACARLPQGMMSITLLLVAAQHASMAVAGLVLAGCTLGAAATAPVRGRLADRRGLFEVSAVCAAGYTLALLGLLAASLGDAPAGLLVAAATAAGLMMPPLSPGVRNLWSVYAVAGLRQTAFALDAAVFDLSYLVGPVLASTLAAGLAPSASLGLVLVLTCAAVAAVGAHYRSRDVRRDDRPGHPVRGPLRSAALRRLLVTAALTNVALSATEVALTAYTRDHHALWASGPLLAAVSAGSITGSLLLGARASWGRSPLGHAATGPGKGARPRWPRLGRVRRSGLGPWLGREREPRLGRLLAGYALGLAGLAAAGLYPPLLAVAAPIAGLCLGPALATLFSAAGAAAPPGTGTEAQAWINSIMNGGAAAGAALAGLVAARPVLGLALAAAAAAVAAVSAGGSRAGGRRAGASPQEQEPAAAAAPASS